MASLIYNNTINHLADGDLNFRVDSFKCLLVTSAYAPNKDSHNFRDDVSGEVIGAGYTAGGNAVTATVTQDMATDRVDITFGSVSWASAAITARAAVIYKSRGGPASQDELVSYVDFGSDVSSSGATFMVTFTSPFRIQN
jgi:hypothetical protein